MCEIDEQQAARVEVQGPKKRNSETGRVRRNARLVLERFAYEDLRQEEANEIGLVPRALSEPRGAVRWCDNRCCDKGLSYTQIASMVTEEGVEQCYSEKACSARQTASEGSGMERDC